MQVKDARKIYFLDFVCLKRKISASISEYWNFKSPNTCISLKNLISVFLAYAQT